MFSVRANPERRDDEMMQANRNPTLVPVQFFEDVLGGFRCVFFGNKYKNLKTHLMTFTDAQANVRKDSEVQRNRFRYRLSSVTGESFMSQSRLIS